VLGRGHTAREEDPGGYVWLNDDDDDADEITDKDDPEVTGGDNDLLHLIMQRVCGGTDTPPGFLRITWNEQDKIDVFETNTKVKWDPLTQQWVSSEIQSGQEYQSPSPSQFPKDLYVEGDQRSTDARRIDMKLQYIEVHNYIEYICSQDKIILTVAPMVDLDVDSDRSGNVDGTAHGSSGRDFTAENWQYLRLYDGTGAGQTAQISARHDGWVEVGTVWNTGSDFVGQSACFYAYAVLDEEASHKSEWFTSPADDSKYVVVEGTRFYANHDTGEDTTPAIVTAKEVFENAELWTFNANAQEIIKGEKPKLQQEAGVDLVFKWVPVIYFAPGVPAQYVVAFTPGAANFKSAGSGQSFFATQYGPRNTSGIDVFQQCVTARLNSPVSTPDWDLYHRFEGEVHCGVAAKRDPFSFKWWERL